jgi:hypothetical protein
MDFPFFYQIKLFNYVNNQGLHDPYYYGFDSFNQRSYEKTL